MGFIEWATSPLGQNVPIHIAWSLIWVALIAGMLFLIVHAIYIRYFAGEKEFAAERCSGNRGAAARPRPPALAGRAGVSLDHGRLHVHAVVYRVLAEGGRPVRLGDLPLDCRRGVDRLCGLSHLPCFLLFGLLVDLAGQSRPRRCREKSIALPG